MKRILILLMLMAAWPDAGADECGRNRASKREFRHTHPCPQTLKTSGPCRGWVVDHIIPLCAAGADDPSNMQWQSKAQSLKKDVAERRYCACLRAKRQDCKLQA